MLITGRKSAAAAVLLPLGLSLCFVAFGVQQQPACARETSKPKDDTPPAVLLTEGRVTRDGFDLYYSVVGESGPYVILLSGGPGGEVDYMLPVAEELSRTFRCVMLEQRGTGRSRLPEYSEKTLNFPAYIEDLEKLREHLKQERVILVGNSWGMMLALAYGGAHPERVQAIVTLGSGVIAAEYAAPFHDNIDARLTLEEKEQIRQIEEQWELDPQLAANERVRARLPGYFYDRRAGLKAAAELPPDSVNHLIVEKGGPVFQSSLNAHVRDRLPFITAPVLLVQGRQDPTPEQSTLEAHRLIHGSQLRFIEKCGHHPWLEKPAEMWKAVHAFLEPLLAEEGEPATAADESPGH